MPLSDIIRLALDSPSLTSQQLADQALVADRIARQLERLDDPRAADARAEADAIADESARRASPFFTLSRWSFRHEYR